jgi:hypothetical protein
MSDVGAGSSVIAEHTVASVVNMKIREKGEGSNYGHEAGEATHIFSPVVVSYTSVISSHPATRYYPSTEKRMDWVLEDAGLVLEPGMIRRSAHRCVS